MSYVSWMQYLKRFAAGTHRATKGTIGVPVEFTVPEVFVFPTVANGIMH